RRARVLPLMPSDLAKVSRSVRLPRARAPSTAGARRTVMGGPGWAGRCASPAARALGGLRIRRAQRAREGPAADQEPRPVLPETHRAAEQALVFRGGAAAWMPEAYLESGGAAAAQRDRRALHHVLDGVARKLASQPEPHEGHGTPMLDSHTRAGPPGAAREALERPEPVADRPLGADDVREHAATPRALAHAQAEGPVPGHRLGAPENPRQLVQAERDAVVQGARLDPCCGAHGCRVEAHRRQLREEHTESAPERHRLARDLAEPSGRDV